MDNTGNFDKDFLQGVQNQIAADNAAQREQSERKKGFLIGAAIGFVLLVIIVLVILLLMPSGE